MRKRGEENDVSATYQRQPNQSCRLSCLLAEVLSPPDGLILFCGMSIGHEDTTVSYARTGRAPLDETVTFVGG